MKLLITLILMGLAASLARAETPIVPLHVKGEDFVDAAGQRVRFWGVNLVACYPDHAQADAIAANLASREINLVRPHHNLRPSSDWNRGMVSGALLTYRDTSREFDADALDRFDYLNAALRKHGIYLALSAHQSRVFRPGDVDILKTDAADADAWRTAMTELNSWDWKRATDPRKMLPAIDERAALLTEEFLRNLLTHVNPYTGRTYAADPQVLTFEIVNESSAEYAIICNNRFPAYWEESLQKRWRAYAASQGIEGGDLYKPADDKARVVRAAFLRKLDADYFARIHKVIRDAGCRAAITYSNLWRGENNLQMQTEQADFIETHFYGDPLVARKADDFINDIAKSAVAGKPLIVSELNQAEGQKNIDAQANVRSMLPLATAAYGSLHNWSGATWFAWCHGTSSIGPDGWAKTESRVPNLGNMVSDGTQIDHLRTAGMMFKRGLVAGSTSPVTVHIDEPLTAGNYNDLMRGKYKLAAGWTNLHAFRKAFGSAASTPRDAAWLQKDRPSPIVSDTGEITKDIAAQTLTVVAPQAEGFSGTLKGTAKLPHLQIQGDGFTTIIAVTDDGRSLGESGSIILSRTALDAAGKDTAATRVQLSGVKDGTWTVRVTRPRADAKAEQVTTQPQGVLTLPSTDWHECELNLQDSRVVVSPG